MQVAAVPATVTPPQPPMMLLERPLKRREWIREDPPLTMTISLAAAEATAAYWLARPGGNLIDAGLI